MARPTATASTKHHAFTSSMCSMICLAPNQCRLVHRNHENRLRMQHLSALNLRAGSNRRSKTAVSAREQTDSHFAGPTQDGDPAMSENSPDEEAENLYAKVAEFGSALARSEEAALLAAQDELRQAQEQQAAAAAVVAGTAVANSTAAAFIGGSSVTASDAASGGPSSADTVPEQPSASSSSGVQVDSSAPAGTGGFNVADAVRDKLARAAECRRQNQEAEAHAAEEGDGEGEPDGSDATSRGPGVYGSANEAAGFLANVMANSSATSPNKDLRAEAFTLLKEEEKKKNVEIITVDQNYAPVGDSEKGYKPKVATWGMFPRPDNISKAYGGGRTLRPGQALESEEDRAARVKRLSEALSKYKRDGGFEIDPEQEAEGQRQFDLGMAAFNKGQLTAALVYFVDAAAVMPLRTPIGGRARLQQAITLDSLGKSQEAKAVYTTLRGHPTAEVAKKVNQLLGGFKAMDFLKAETISYRIKTGEYDKYFRSVASTYNSAYYLADGGEKEDLKVPTAVATAVMLAPILLLGVKVAQKALF